MTARRAVIEVRYSKKEGRWLIRRRGQKAFDAERTRERAIRTGSDACWFSWERGNTTAQLDVYTLKGTLSFTRMYG